MMFAEAHFASFLLVMSILPSPGRDTLPSPVTGAAFLEMSFSTSREKKHSASSQVKNTLPSPETALSVPSPAKAASSQLKDTLPSLETALSVPSPAKAASSRVKDTLPSLETFLSMPSPAKAASSQVQDTLPSPAKGTLPFQAMDVAKSLRKGPLSPQGVYR